MFEANIVPRKNREKLSASSFVFFSFCDAVHVKVPNQGTFIRESRVLQVATSPPDAILHSSHLADAFGDCRSLTAHAATRSSDHASRLVMRGDGFAQVKNALDRSFSEFAVGLSTTIACSKVGWANIFAKKTDARTSIG
jgi:hypothetical protein